MIIKLRKNKMVKYELPISNDVVYFRDSTLNIPYVRVEGLKNYNNLFQIWYTCQQNGFQDQSPKDDQIYTLHNHH